MATGTAVLALFTASAAGQPAAGDRTGRAQELVQAIERAGDRAERLSLIRQLGQTGEPESTRAALELVEKSDVDERLATAEGLSRGRVFEAIPALTRLARSESDPGRQTRVIACALALLEAGEDGRRRDDAVACISSLLSAAIRVEDRNRIVASLAADGNRCEFGYVVAQAWMRYPGLEDPAQRVADELAAHLGFTPHRQPCWGEYEGECGGRKAMAMVVPEKHADREFAYRIRVVGQGIDTSIEGRPDRGGISIDDQGWKGRVRDGRIEACRGEQAIRMNYRERTSPTLGQKPPAGAIPLLPFEAGRAATAAAWENTGWRLLSDGSMESGRGYNTTSRPFGSCRLHVEFATPFMPQESGQGRGNSGIYLMGRYEIQVLDSFGDNPQEGNCGGIYGRAAPLVRDVQLPPMQWQTYDITFRRPGFDAAGSVTEPACFEQVVHNGVVIHTNVRVPEPTAAALWTDQKPTGPLALQDHGTPVRYRNIWIVPEDGSE